ncbi:MAG: metal ABC transporter permease [Ignavibacteriales bacterium]|nr:metal ABC transporter permease [Ignavibacteriales bacterium]
MQRGMIAAVIDRHRLRGRRHVRRPARHGVLRRRAGAHHPARHRARLPHQRWRTGYIVLVGAGDRRRRRAGHRRDQQECRDQGGHRPSASSSPGCSPLGIALISTVRSYAVDLSHFLFGDVLSVSTHSLWLILTPSADSSSWPFSPSTRNSRPYPSTPYSPPHCDSLSELPQQPSADPHRRDRRGLAPDRRRGVDGRHARWLRRDSPPRSRIACPPWMILAAMFGYRLRGDRPATCPFTWSIASGAAIEVDGDRVLYARLSRGKRQQSANPALPALEHLRRDLFRRNWECLISVKIHPCTNTPQTPCDFAIILSAFSFLLAVSVPPPPPKRFPQPRRPSSQPRQLLPQNPLSPPRPRPSRRSQPSLERPQYAIDLRVELLDQSRDA